MTQPVLRALIALLLAATTAPVSQAYALASPEAPTTAPVSTDPCLAPEGAAACTWERTIGGAGDDGATALASTADGAVWVAGYTNSTGTGRYAAWLTRLDATDGRPLASHTQAPGRFAAAMAVTALPTAARSRSASRSRRTAWKIRSWRFA